VLPLARSLHRLLDPMETERPLRHQIDCPIFPPMKFLLSNRFTILLISLMAFILIVPPVVEYSGSMVVVPWALSAIVFAIVLATYGGRERIMRSLMIIAALAALSGLWSCNYFVGVRQLEETNAALFAFLLFSACVSTLRQLSRRRRVDRETLAAALAAYVLFGMAMSWVFSLVHLFDPDAFHIALSEGTASAQPSFLYFSFVVLSTVGFGDITPASAIARSLMIVEAIFGVFYLAVVISRLVSLYRRDEGEEEN
jgi:voltage-gated potassium channel